MGVDSNTLTGWLADYDRDNITIGVVASHSSLQILHGARVEGFRTLGIAVGENRRRFYKAFPGAEPDEWLMLENYREMLDHAEWFRERNVVIIPHGSLVEYLGSSNFRELQVPTFGNRGILHWKAAENANVNGLKPAVAPCLRSLKTPTTSTARLLSNMLALKVGVDILLLETTGTLDETSILKRNSRFRNTFSVADTIFTSFSTLLPLTVSKYEAKVAVQERI